MKYEEVAGYMKNVLRKSGLPVLMLLLCSAVFLTSCGKNSEENAGEQNTAQEEAVRSEPVYTPAVPDPDAPDKKESVHVTADPSGRPVEISVETTLKNPGGTLDPIRDASSLTDIRNREGDEEFTLEDGLLVWENHGEDILYEGKSDRELPVSVALTYSLDGEEILPEKLAGKSGRVRIRFDYENRTLEEVSVKGAVYRVPIPFAAVTAVFLPSDHFRNVKVTNGKVLDLDDRKVVIGYAMPGLASVLHLSAYEPTEDIEIPEYVEVEADAEDFQLDFTATVLTNSLLKDLEEEDLKEIDDLTEGMDDFTEAIDELADGTGEMADGLREFRDYLKEYTDGVKSVSSGTAALDKGIQALSANKGALLDGSKALESALKDLVNGFELSVPGVSDEDLKEITEAAEGLLGNAKKLQKKLEQAGITQEQLVKTGKEISDYIESQNLSVKKIRKQLKKIDFDSLETAANKKARSQAEAALDEALANLDLTEKQKKKIKKKVKKSIDIHGIAEEAGGNLIAAISGMDNLPKLSAADFSMNDKEIQKILKKMGKQAKTLQSHSDVLEKLFEQLVTLDAAMQTTKAGFMALADGATGLRQGIKAFNSGIDQLAKGSSELKKGALKLSEAGGELTDGMDEVIEAADSIADGVGEFRDDGVKDLQDLAGEDLQRIVDTIRALQAADVRYDNYGGILEGASGEVRFLIETEEIR